MSNTNKYLAATVAAVVGLGLSATTTSAVAASGDKEKCYGVVKAGKNDCGTADHACAGQAKTDNDPNEWIYLSKGVCDRLSNGKTKS